MGESLQTRPSLLVRLRDPQDRESWQTFLDLYAPLIYGFARKSGVAAHKHKFKLIVRKLIVFVIGIFICQRFQNLITHW